jgi:hypothetical protein
MPEVIKGYFWVGNETIALSGFHDYIINVDLHIAPDLSFETGLHTLLVGGSCVL